MILVQMIRSSEERGYDADILGTFVDPQRALAFFAKKELFEFGGFKVHGVVLNTDHVDQGGHIVDDWFVQYEDLKVCLEYLHRKGLC